MSKIKLLAVPLLIFAGIIIAGYAMIAGAVVWLASEARKK